MSKNTVPKEETTATSKKPKAVFTVGHFRELLETAGAADVYNLNAAQAIGARGAALIGAYAGMFSGNLEEFAKKLKKLPLAMLKTMLQEIISENIGKNRGAIQKDLEDSFTDKDIEDAIIGMAGTKKFTLTTELPESKLEVKFLPLTETRVAKIDTTSRYDLVSSSIVSVEGEILTKKGVTDRLDTLPYADFEYIYAYMDLVNIKLASVDWKTIVKNL